VSTEIDEEMDCYGTADFEAVEPTLRTDIETVAARAGTVT